MSLLKIKYNQTVDSQAREGIDKFSIGHIKNLLFRTNKLIFPKHEEGLSSWKNRTYNGVFITDSWALIPFDVQEIKSQWIYIYKTSLHKFRVSKTGFYEFNVNWLTEIGNINILKTTGTRLAIGKNGDAEGTDNFVRLDSRQLTIPITGVADAWAYSSVSHLQGTKVFYMEKNIDYVEFFFKHSSQNVLSFETVHSGFVEIKYLGTKARSLL